MKVAAGELVFLEMRPTNAEALRLYESFGFQVIGRRKGHYFDTGEDALVMEAPLTPGGVAGAVGRDRGTDPFRRELFVR